MNPLISVVIPTLHRPQLVLRALTSVFCQTYEEIEVIVVIDGPDQESASVLSELKDPRLRVVMNPKSLTAAGARNAGIDHSRGEWVAFLDDDDEWLPQKLSRQLLLAKARNAALITCLSRVVSPRHATVRPRLIYDNIRPVDEYLFDRPSPLAPTGFIQTSSYLVHRSVLERARFRVDTPHDDWDFILHISKRLGVCIETVPEVLVIVHVDEHRQSLSSKGTWPASLAWIDSVRAITSRRAYSGFCLGVVASHAARQRGYWAFFILLWRAFRYGSPRVFHVAWFISVWLVPPTIRRRLRTVLQS